MLSGTPERCGGKRRNKRWKPPALATSVAVYRDLRLGGRQSRPRLRSASLSRSERKAAATSARGDPVGGWYTGSTPVGASTGYRFQRDRERALSRRRRKTSEIERALADVARELTKLDAAVDQITEVEGSAEEAIRQPRQNRFLAASVPLYSVQLDRVDLSNTRGGGMGRLLGSIVCFAVVLMVAAAGALASDPHSAGSTGQPSQSCQSEPTGPPGIISTTNGFATHAVNVYAGSAPQNSNNPKSVSQYDVACFEVSSH